MQLNIHILQGSWLKICSEVEDLYFYLHNSSEMERVKGLLKMFHVCYSYQCHKDFIVVFGS